MKQMEKMGCRGAHQGAVDEATRVFLSDARHDFTTASMLADDRTHADGAYATQH